MIGRFVAGHMPGRGQGGGGADAGTTAQVTALREQRREITAVYSLASVATLPNGAEYLPLTSPLLASVKPGIAGTIAIGMIYAMNAANAGDVDLRLDAILVDVGDDPDPDLDGATPDDDTVTPGNDTLEHEHEWQVTVTATERVRFRISDLATGTHGGTVRVLGVYWREVVA